jgi:rubrerythrin
MSITLQNLESALAGESMAHIKYRYLPRLLVKKDLKKLQNTLNILPIKRLNMLGGI